MAKTNDVVVTEIVEGVKAAHTAVHAAVGEQLAKGRDRLRSSSKTRKSVMTRKRIMTAASELMVERGSTAFQMSEVSERCHMSKGALYYYFSDRDELIAAIFDELVDDLVDSIEGVVSQAPSASDALRRLFGEFARRLRAGSPLALAVTHQLVGSPGVSMPEVTSHFVKATKIIASQVERAKGEGLVRNDVDSMVAAVFATGGFVAISLGVAERQFLQDPDVVATNLVEMTLRGIGTEDASLALYSAEL